MEILSTTLDPKTIEHESGCCFRAIIPAFRQGDDSEYPDRSQLELFEDDRPLRPAHSLHDDIRHLGGGRYSHWGDSLYFSSSDQSDPRSSGRKYLVRGPKREGLIPHPSVVRGHEVVPSFIGSVLPQTLVDEMGSHPEAAGKSSWGTRNVLHAFVLAMRPTLFLEVGAHIGSASVVVGAAMKANGFGTLYCLEPQDHYFTLLQFFVEKAGLSDFVKPLQMLSTSRELDSILGDQVDMIYLDADHSYSAASADLRICERLLRENGLLFLDDVGPEVSPSLDPEGRGGVRQALLDWSKGRADLHVIFLEPPAWLNPCGMAIVCRQRVLSRQR